MIGLEGEGGTVKIPPIIWPLPLVNILLIDLSIFMDSFNLGTVHHDFGSSWGGGRNKILFPGGK